MPPAETYTHPNYMKTPTDGSLLAETKAAFENVKGSIVVAMQKLHAVKESGDWESVANTWSEYVESELGISQGFASKLLSVNKHYLIEGGYSPANISGVDYESLYLAAKTEGTVEEQIERARTLTRAELRQERNEQNDHTHEAIQICKHCSMRM